MAIYINKIKRFSINPQLPKKIFSEFEKIKKLWKRENFDEYLNLIINSEEYSKELNESERIGDWYPIIGLGVANYSDSNYIAYNTKIKKFGIWKAWHKENNSYEPINQPLKEVFRNYFLDRWLWVYVEEPGNTASYSESKEILKNNLKLIDSLNL